MSEAGDTVEELDGLVLEVLERMESEGADALERACAAHPSSSAALRRRVAALRDAGLLEEPEAAFPERLGDFRLLEHLGGGGMGVVFRARQETLGREVALKLIRPDLLFFPDARQRFRREVETVARLQHPGIVPVYTVGEEGGVPYFAMERVRGATLAEVLAELGARDPTRLRGRDLGLALERVLARRGLPARVAAPLFEGAWVDACLRIVESVALALEHAHAEGVLHRDVKPSNVLLAADGRALLFDFGLSASEGASELSKSGALIGSLPYMAPEQVRGERVDRRTDVWGLGATLHELLALAPPYRASGTAALRAAIQAGGAAPPSARNRAVSRDLDLVTARAMDPEPERRYASAAALARDLANVRELRPVTARPAGPLLRARRWTQRHPARAAALALAASLAIGLPSALAVQRGRANVRIAAALAAAEAERSRAEANLDRAVDAVAYLLGEVADETLADVPGLTEVRVRLFERALALLSELEPQRPGDPALAVQRARLLGETALVIEDVGHSAQAEAFLREAEGHFRAALAHEPESRALREALARALMNRAGLAIDRWRFDEGEAPLQEALALWEELAAAEPHEREVALGRRQALANLSSLRHAEGRGAEALALVEEALALARELVAREPDARALDALADTLGRLAVASSDPALEESVRREELSILDGLLAEKERELWLARATSSAVHLSKGLSGQGRVDEALRVARDALPRAERLVGDYPADLDHRRLLASLQESLALSLAWLGDHAAALEWLRRASATLEPLASAPDASPWQRLDRAVTLSNYSNAALDAGELDEARAANEAALAAFEPLLGEMPGYEPIRVRSALAELLRAGIAARDGHPPAPEVLEELVAERAPDDPQVRFVLGLTLAVCAEAAGAPTDGTSGPPEAEHYIERAFEALTRALQLGYRTVHPLEQIRELDGLRARPEYEAVLGAAAR